jgi:hypothetical protein
VQQLGELLDRYRRTLQTDRQYLLQQFRLTRVGRKVAGVGSVGTRAWILLMDAAEEPLIPQAKEAQTSVLSDSPDRLSTATRVSRVVAGQHLMQATSDIFLGWQQTTGPDGVDRDFYVRQLRDWKFSMPIEQMQPDGMGLYAGMSAWTLARAHACSGDRVAIAAYLGKSDTFEGEVTPLRVSPGWSARRESRESY